MQSTQKNKKRFQGILNGPENVAAPRDGNLIARDERKELDARHGLLLITWFVNTACAALKFITQIILIKTLKKKYFFARINEYVLEPLLKPN